MTLAIVCGWREAKTIIRCERCAEPMLEWDARLQFCTDCREWMRAWRR